MKLLSKWLLTSVMVLLPLASQAQVEQIPEDLPLRPGAPIDRGQSPDALFSIMASVPIGGPGGAFGAPISWPIIPIHVTLLPDGRVLNFGTDETGAQGAQLVYDVWDPVSGGHTVLPNTTSTDIFCAGQSLLTTGEVLMVGGDQTINGQRNFSNDRATLFSPTTNSIRSDVPMLYPRWYPTSVPLNGNGQVLVVGGREDKGNAAVITPELYTPGIGWRTLTGAASDAAFGYATSSFYYPRAWLAGNSKIFVLANDGNMFYVNRVSAGSIAQVGGKIIQGSVKLPAVMFAPGKILSLRIQKWNYVVNINTNPPTATRTANRDALRYWSSALVLPDGKVLVTGGSDADNQLVNVSYAATIWDPATGVWTTGATAAKPRLYHSVSLLLPDATVLVAGGGADGPVNNLNAEIYYPRYLYNASGNLAPRPTLAGVPAAVQIGAGPFTATVGAADTIGKVTLIRTGAMTHSLDVSQRFLRPSFVQSGSTVTITLPTANKSVMPPGYYMLFVFNGAGVPSIAKIINVTG